MKSDTRAVVNQVLSYATLISLIVLGGVYDWSTRTMIITFIMWGAGCALFSMFLAFFSEMHLEIKETIGYKRAMRAVALTVIYEVSSRSPLRRKQKA